MTDSDQAWVFAVKINKIWIMRCVDIPKDISRSMQTLVPEGAKHIPVCGFIEGLPFRNMLVPRGGGTFRMHIHSSIWRKLRIDAGAAVEITLRLDTEPREPVLPPDLAAGLAETPRALATFNVLTPALRRQIIRYLELAKQIRTREKRVQIIVKRMLERSARTNKGRKRPKIQKKSAARKKRKSS